MNREDLELLVSQGLSYRNIASLRSVSLATIKYWGKKHGIPSKHRAFSANKHECKTCGERRPEEFYGHRKGTCKKCFIAEDVVIGIAKKKQAIEYMGGKCFSCGYDKYYGALHFHHVNPADKEDWGSFRCWGWTRIKREIDKCILVCAVCHAEIHGGIQDNTKFVPGPPVRDVSA
ncbi:MAG: hypothetical protein EOP84_08720 [Verrucomicrobiaceae bacterium]|nr:MAG: hypothetical protein EOP84_08720 [Verrucomicrobiaceae bacterium]